MGGEGDVASEWVITGFCVLLTIAVLIMFYLFGKLIDATLACTRLRLENEYLQRAVDELKAKLKAAE